MVVVADGDGGASEPVFACGGTIVEPETVGFDTGCLIAGDELFGQFNGFIRLRGLEVPAKAVLLKAIDSCQLATGIERIVHHGSSILAVYHTYIAVLGATCQTGNSIGQVLTGSR